MVKATYEIETPPVPSGTNPLGYVIFGPGDKTYLVRREDVTGLSLKEINEKIVAAQARDREE